MLLYLFAFSACSGSADPTSAIDLSGDPGAVRTIARTVTEGAPSVPGGVIKLANSGNCPLSFRAEAIANTFTPQSGADIRWFSIGTDGTTVEGTIAAPMPPATIVTTEVPVTFGNMGNIAGLPSRLYTGSVRVTGECRDVTPPKPAGGSPATVVVSLNVQPKFANLSTPTPVVTADETGAPPLTTWTPASTSGAPAVVGASGFIGGYVVIVGEDASGDPRVYRFDPFTNTWPATTQPTGGYPNSSIGFGNHKLVLFPYAAGRESALQYDPVLDRWNTDPDTNIPDFGAGGVGQLHSMGSELITMNPSWVRAYNPEARSWRSFNTNAPNQVLGRINTVKVWTGTRLLVWGGATASLTTFYNDGASLDPSVAPDGSWKTISAAPITPRVTTGVWTGSRMFVWGGASGGTALFGDGALYDSEADAWVTTAAANAPVARGRHSLVWTGRHVIVHGGISSAGGSPLFSGAVFDPFAGSGGSWIRPLPDGGPNSTFLSGMWAAGKFVTFGYPAIGWILE
jgi:hypothetical protein